MCYIASMELITNQSYNTSRKAGIIRAIKSGKIFIYPTDTIYGIGCDATNEASVQKIRELKHREAKPFLVVAPSLVWISENCDMSKSGRREIEDKFPGPYAFFLKLKNKKAIAPSVSSDGTIGVRYLNHEFQKIITEAGVPFVTTSVNIFGELHAETLEEFPESIKCGVEYIIYEGPITGLPSIKIDLAG